MLIQTSFLSLVAFNEEDEHLLDTGIYFLCFPR